MAAPGRRNLLTDVAGLAVGSAHDAAAVTGVTVVLPDEPAVAAVDVRGGGPGTRETDSLAPHSLVGMVHAIVLAGGSVYGLAAAEGVTAALGAAGVGYRLRPTSPAPPSPIVPAAILYDLANEGDKAWGDDPPYARLGREALAAAAADFALGRAGAGYGARAGATLGGLGSASAVTADGITVAALAAVNAFGSVRMPGSEAFWAWPWEQMWNGAPELGGARPDASTLATPIDLEDWGAAKLDPRSLLEAVQGRTNTTIAVVATDAALTTAQAKRLAVMAQTGVPRAIRPAHAPFDGDVVFALSTARTALPDPAPLSVARLGALAADCLARAIARGVWQAEQSERT
jgi:L-aminopeptidase/D-esterase-like protein